MAPGVKVAVVGAGAAGLCALRHLTSSQVVDNSTVSVIYDVTCYEQSNKVGGTWVYTDSIEKDEYGLPIHSSMYKNMRTNLPVQCMAFPDFPFRCGSPSFVKHEVVQQYLEDYTSCFNLIKYIKFLTLVELIQPVEANEDNPFQVKWEITTSNVANRKEQTSEIFDAVLVCNGHYAEPKVPLISGLQTFSGNVCHSHNYRTPDDYSGKVVVVLGAGPSGQDISLELATVAKQVYLSHNKPLLACKLPENLLQKPGVQCITCSTVVFLDGSQVEADVLFLCTGYNYNYGFLSPSCGVSITDDRITPLFKHTVHTKFPNLGFVGVCKTIIPFPMFDVQIRFFRAILDGTCILPDEVAMNADTEEDYRRRLAEGLPHRHAHTMGTRQFGFLVELADMAKISHLPPHFEQIYQSCHALRQSNLVGYKDFNFSNVDVDNYSHKGNS